MVTGGSRWGGTYVEDKGMRRWFWGAAVLTTLLVLSVGTILYQKQKLDETESLKQDAVAAVAAWADHFAVWAGMRIAELRVMAGTAAVRSGDAREALAYLAEERTRHTDMPLLGLIGRDGTVVFPDGSSAIVTEAGAVRKESDGGLLYGSVEGPHGEPCLVLAVPYERTDGAPGGALGSFVPLAWVHETFYSYTLAEEQTVYFLAGDAAYRLTEDGMPAEEPAIAGLIGPRDEAESGAIWFERGGEDYLLVYGSAQGTPWRLAAAAPGRLLLASEGSGVWRTAAGFVLLEAALLLMLFIYQQGFASRFRDLKIRLAQMSHAARHDLLTALPNRLHLRESLNALIRSHPFSGHNLIGLVLIDLDRFKNVNDTLGHNAGDRLLTAAAGQLSRALREGQRLFRLGGDEFVLLFEGVWNAEEGVAEAERILGCLREPIRIGNHEFIVTASAGISFYPQHAASGGELLRNADLAMYRAKKQGIGCLVCYDESMVEQTTREVMIEQHLRKAVAEGELTLVYQPIQAIGKGKSGLCAEALLRWYSKELGQVRPDLFIPIAESTGLIVEIGDWVLRQACAQLGLWRRGGLPIDRVSVNLSAIQLEQPGFVDKVRTILAETGCGPDGLMLELTESSVISRMDLIVKTLGELSDLGITIALDDFGIGYSSLSVLNQLDIDVLKIDRSFIARIHDGSKDEALVKVILSIAGLLGIDSIAEGVETEEQLEMLRDMHCTHAQGYLLSKPLERAEFERYAINYRNLGLT
jgi:diguanylate cyclase (GGDEF)-like protein